MFVCSVRREMDGEVDTMQQTIQDLEQASDPLYMPDPDPSKIPIDRTLTRKAGYLNLRKYASYRGHRITYRLG